MIESGIAIIFGVVLTFGGIYWLDHSKPTDHPILVIMNIVCIFLGVLSLVYGFGVVTA